MIQDPVFCKGVKEKPDVTDNGDGTYDVTYKPPKEGTPIVASVKWNGKDVPNTYVTKRIPDIWNDNNRSQE